LPEFGTRTLQDWFRICLAFSLFGLIHFIIKSWLCISKNHWKMERSFFFAIHYLLVKMLLTWTFLICVEFCRNVCTMSQIYRVDDFYVRDNDKKFLFLLLKYIFELILFLLFMMLLLHRLSINSNHWDQKGICLR